MFSSHSEYPELLVTIPVHNEKARIEATVSSLRDSLPRVGIPYRLSISEDGSTDGTPRVVLGLQRDFPELLTITDPEKRGRGYALRNLWNSVQADIYAFTDADLPAGPEALALVIAAVQNGADVATGSRYMVGAHLNRPPLRSFVSRIYNWLVRSTFHDDIYDHQCGVKAFSRSALETLLPQSKEDSWFWDTEILVLAKNAGMRVAEIPVDWSEQKYKLTSIRRLLADVFLHGAGFVRLAGRMAEPTDRGALIVSPPLVQPSSRRQILPTWAQHSLGAEDVGDTRTGPRSPLRVSQTVEGTSRNP
jgi:glycosyltransferase involved in cell wall biosynthesis